MVKSFWELIRVTRHEKVSSVRVRFLCSKFSRLHILILAEFWPQAQNSGVGWEISSLIGVNNSHIISKNCSDSCLQNERIRQEFPKNTDETFPSCWFCERNRQYFPLISCGGAGWEGLGCEASVGYEGRAQPFPPIIKFSGSYPILRLWFIISYPILTARPHIIKFSRSYHILRPRMGTSSWYERLAV